MKRKINNICKPGMVVVAMLVVLFSSCADEYPVNVDSPNEVVLKSIKILNAGADGNTIVEGRVDENSKTE